MIVLLLVMILIVMMVTAFVMMAAVTIMIMLIVMLILTVLIVMVVFLIMLVGLAISRVPVVAMTVSEEAINNTRLIAADRSGSQRISATTNFHVLGGLKGRKRSLLLIASGNSQHTHTHIYT